MNRISKVQFVAQGHDTIDRYDEDNRWFKFLSGGLWEKSWPVGQYILTAQSCYDKVGKTTTDMLLLGDDKIRKDSQIIDTFGLATALDVQEPEVMALVEAIQKKRNEDVPKQAPNPPGSLKDPKFAPNNPLPVVGEGSVLSTRGWSPMLNDAFIMSGIHSNFDFLLSLAKVDREAFQKVAATKRAPKDTWLAFLSANIGMFWSEKPPAPRVFVRELIGLKTFGYKPDFKEMQLGFACTDKSKADGASLPKYLDALFALGFHKPDRSQLLAEISSYLFDDPKALTTPAKAA